MPRTGIPWWVPYIVIFLVAVAIVYTHNYAVFVQEERMPMISSTRETAMDATAKALPPPIPKGYVRFPDEVKGAGWTVDDTSVTLPPNTIAKKEALQSIDERCLVELQDTARVWINCSTPHLVPKE